MSSDFSIDGFGPLRLEQPASAAEVGNLVRRAATDNLAVYPVGGGTMLHLGLPPGKNGYAVSLSTLNQVIDYPARDMTITVQAGITVAKLNEILASEKQRLPIDVPEADKATLGGILATNTSGPRRCGYGTLRDYVLGITVVNDEGQEVKAGGRVVKNVAGYDLPKLYIGSLGTLGIITQVTLKLRPRPDEQAIVLVDCTTETVGHLLDSLASTRAKPVCVDLLNSAAADALLHKRSWLVVVGFEGHSETVFWQVNQLVKELGSDFTLDVRLGRTAEPVWNALTNSARQAGASVTLKASMLSHETAQFAVTMDQQANPRLHAHAGNGIVRGYFSEAGPETIQSWRRLCKHVIVERCSSDRKRDLDVWGPPPRDIALMKSVKARLDPRGLFNPGRFLDSI